MNFKAVPFNGDALDGIVQNIQNHTGIEDIVNSNYLKIDVPSTRSDSNEAKIIFGIGNEGYTSYWSSNNNEPNKYVLISFKFPSIIQGIGIRTLPIDLYSTYTIKTSIDMINWDSDTINSLEKNNGESHFWEHYFQLSNLKLCRFVIIIPGEPYGEGTLKVSNFAFYGLEFFGKFLFSPYLSCAQCINTRSNMLLYTSLLIIYS